MGTTRVTPRDTLVTLLLANMPSESTNRYGWNRGGIELTKLGQPNMPGSLLRCEEST